MASAEICFKSTIAVLSRVPNMISCLREVLPTIEFREIQLGTPKSNLNFALPETNLADHSLKQLQEAEIIVADFNLIAPFLYNLPKTHWIQGTWAGADPMFKVYDSTKPSFPFTVTRFSGDFFGSQMAEYVVASVVNRERHLPYLRECQRSHTWCKNDVFPRYRHIKDLIFTILGCGNIGNHIASVLHAFGAKVWGVGRTPKDELPPYIYQYRTLPALEEALAAADYVVSVLPGTSGTEGLLGGGVLRACAGRRAVLVNVGRGSVVSEADLLHALRSGWLRGAVLDVFPEEPLPPDSPLWDEPQVDITPHISGVTRPEDVALFFHKNLERYIAGKPLLAPLDFEKRY